MVKIIEAVYENGVLKPVDASGLTEQRRYRLTLEELPAPEPPLAPDVAAELARRTTLLPDGRRVFHLLGLFDRGDPGPDYDDIEAALDAARQATRSP
jgi:predicted DNA-binding antitoxin AbrB/MazE fold protein